MKTQGETASVTDKMSTSLVENLLGRPEVLYEGILAMEVGLDLLHILPGDDLDAILKKTEVAFSMHPYASSEIAISAIAAGIPRTGSQGGAVDFTLSVAKVFDRSMSGKNMSS